MTRTEPPTPGPRGIARGIRIDVADEAIIGRARRNAVRTAILRARPL
ncbi:hypothetical protein [Methylobacterium sp. ID0610]